MQLRVKNSVRGQTQAMLDINGFQLESLAINIQRGCIADYKYSICDLSSVLVLLNMAPLTLLYTEWL